MILFGRRDTFAIEAIPLQGGPADGDPSAELTWCGWAIWVEGMNLSAHTRLDDDKVSPTINWPAIFLARWFVRSWGRLFEQPRWPIPTRVRNARLVEHELNRLAVERDDDLTIDLRDDFVSSHDLRSGAGGGNYPGVYFSRDGDVVTVTWSSPPDDVCVFHRQEGEADIRSGAFSHAVEQFVGWVLTLLRDVPATENDRALLRDWLDYRVSDSAATAVILGHAGLATARVKALEKRSGTSFDGFFALSGPWSEAHGDVSPSVSAVAMAFRSLSPTISDDDLIAIRDLVLNAGGNLAGAAALEAFRSRLSEPTRGARDYEQGYDLAIAVRDALGNPDQVLDIDALLQKDFLVEVRELVLAPEIEGGCIFDKQRGPVIFVNPSARSSSSTWGRRMTLAHELCHLLFDRPPRRTLAHFSGIWSVPRLERRANAFAAELLLPRAGIVRVLGTEPVDPGDVDLERLMKTFNVGITTVTWHVENRFNPERATL